MFPHVSFFTLIWSILFQDFVCGKICLSLPSQKKKQTLIDDLRRKPACWHRWPLHLTNHQGWPQTCRDVQFAGALWCSRIVGCTPYVAYPLGIGPIQALYGEYLWVKYLWVIIIIIIIIIIPPESLENTISTMGTLLGVP